VPEPAEAATGPRSSRGRAGAGAEQGPGCTMEMLMAATRGVAGDKLSAEPVFECQATELDEAAPEQIDWWDLRRYVP
jgi:hypothetical protein